jgi:hypothetical protein
MRIKSSRLRYRLPMIPARIGGPYIKNIEIIIAAGHLASPADLKMHRIPDKKAAATTAGSSLRRLLIGSSSPD